MELKFVTGKPALLYGKSLVLADLHLGIEHAFYKSGLKIPSQTPKLIEEIESLIKETKAERIVFLGDVKHKVPGVTFQEEREVPAFFRHFSGLAEVIILPGNHDGNLQSLLPKDVRIKPSSGFLLGKLFLFHGHAWPSPDFLEADYVAVGHEHPRLELKDRLGALFSEQVWLRTELDRKAISKRFKTSEKKKLPGLIIMPAFNPLLGGIAMNRPKENINKQHSDGGIGPLVRSSSLYESDMHLLDGTHLGKLRNFI